MWYSFDFMSPTCKRSSFFSTTFHEPSKIKNSWSIQAGWVLILLIKMETLNMKVSIDHRFPLVFTTCSVHFTRSTVHHRLVIYEHFISSNAKWEHWFSWVAWECVLLCIFGGRFHRYEKSKKLLEWCCFQWPAITVTDCGHLQIMSNSQICLFLCFHSFCIFFLKSEPNSIRAMF